MIRRASYLIVLILFLTTTSLFSADSSKESAALSAAEDWLSLIDNQDYEESWTQTSELFRSAVQSDQWVQSLRVVRKPLGKLISRKLKTKTHTTSLPGAPDGKYVVIQFETSFENKKTAIETVTPMIDKDGVWRVSGYYIK